MGPTKNNNQEKKTRTNFDLINDNQFRTRKTKGNLSGYKRINNKKKLKAFFLSNYFLYHILYFI